MLRRRHFAKTEAARETKGWQDADEARRSRRDPGGSVPGGTQDGNGNRMTADFKKSTVREYFESIVIAVILALFIRTFAVQAFKIPTGSMENNLLIGDHLLVNKFVFAPCASAIERAILPTGTIHRRDVIGFKYPVDPTRGFINRRICLPGAKLKGLVPVVGPFLTRARLDRMLHQIH